MAWAAVAQVVMKIGETAMTVMSARQQAAATEAQGRQAMFNAQSSADDADRRNDAVRARQHAITGASGVESAGSPLEIMLDTAKEAELESERILWQGRQIKQAKFDEAKAQRMAGYMQAGMSWLNPQGGQGGGGGGGLGSILGGMYGGGGGSFPTSGANGMGAGLGANFAFS